MSHVLLIATSMSPESSSKHSSWWSRKLNQQKHSSDSGQSTTKKGVFQALRSGSSKIISGKDYGLSSNPGSTTSMDGASSSRSPTVTITSHSVSLPSGTLKGFDDTKELQAGSLNRSKLREPDPPPGRYRGTPIISSDALSKTVVHHTLISPSQSPVSPPIDAPQAERRRRSYTTAASPQSSLQLGVEPVSLSSGAGPSRTPPPRPKRADRNLGTHPLKDTSDIRPHVSRGPSYSLSGRDQITNMIQGPGPYLVPAHVPKHQSLSSPSSLENIRHSQQSPEQSTTSAPGRRISTIQSGPVTSMANESSVSFSSSASSGDGPPAIDISAQTIDYSPELEASPSDMTFAERPHPSPVDPTLSHRSTARPITDSNNQSFSHWPRPSSHPVVASVSAEPKKPPSSLTREDSSLSVPSSSPARGSGNMWNNVLKRQKSLAFASRNLEVEHPLRHYNSFSSPGSAMPPDGATSSSSGSMQLSMSGASSPSPGSPTSATSNGSVVTDSNQHDVVSKQFVGPLVEPVSASQIEDAIPRRSRYGRRRGASVTTIDRLSQLIAPSEPSGSSLPVAGPVETVVAKRGSAADSLGVHILPPDEVERVLQTTRASGDGKGSLDSPRAKLRVNTAPLSPSLSITSSSDRAKALRRISESPSTSPTHFMPPPSLSRQSSGVSKNRRSHTLQRPSTGGGLTSFGGQPIVPPANVIQMVHSLPPPPRRSHSRVPHVTLSSIDRQLVHQVTSTVSVGPTRPSATLDKVSSESPNNGYRVWPGPDKTKPPGRPRRISATSGTTVTTAVSAEDFPEPPKAMISVISGPTMVPPRTRSILKRPSFLDISSETDEPEPINFLELDNRASFEADPDSVAVTGTKMY